MQSFRGAYLLTDLQRGRCTPSCLVYCIVCIPRLFSNIIHNIQTVGEDLLQRNIIRFVRNLHVQVERRNDRTNALFSRDILTHTRELIDMHEQQRSSQVTTLTLQPQQPRCAIGRCTQSCTPVYSTARNNGTCVHL